MPQSPPVWNKIDQQVTSEPLTVGAYTVQLVAHLTGWRLHRRAANGGFGAAQVRLQPSRLLVRHGAAESNIPLADPVRLTQAALVRSALAISLICSLIMFVARRLAKNHPKLKRVGE